MKLLVAVLIALFTVSSVLAPAFAAATLPDYQKSGKLGYTLACDKGQNTIRKYTSKEWRVWEIRTYTGDIFVELDSDEPKFFMKLAGSSQMQDVTHQVWDKNLKAKAPAVFYWIHSGGPSDCVKR